MPDVLLGWDDTLCRWQEHSEPGAHGTGRVSRIDRGWSTILRHRCRTVTGEKYRCRRRGRRLGCGR